MPRPARKRRYTDEQRATALAALAANRGNVCRTARQLGLPAKTLEHWGKGERHPEAAEMGVRKKAALADAFEAVAWRILDAIPPKVAGAPLGHAAAALGICVDKMRLLRAEPAAAPNAGAGGGPDLCGLTGGQLARLGAACLGAGAGRA